MEILYAESGDLPAILALQRLTYQSEAALVHDFSIPPLTQTLEGITADLAGGVIMKAVPEGNPQEIIGSVRGCCSENTLRIGRLIVHPSHQNRGVGTALLSRIESLYPHTRYELFTSDRSGKNLSLYIKNGYREFKREPLNEHVTLVYLEKRG